MTSEPKKEVFLRRSSKRMLEGQRCYEASASTQASCCNSYLNGGCMSRLLRILVDTAVTRASDLADDIVRQSDKQSVEATCGISSSCPEQASLLSI